MKRLPCPACSKSHNRALGRRECIARRAKLITSPPRYAKSRELYASGPGLDAVRAAQVAIPGHVGMMIKYAEDQTAYHSVGGTHNG